MVKVATTLSEISFARLTNWSVRHLLGSVFSYSDTYPLVPIGDFLKQSRRLIVLQEDVSYKRLTVRLKSGGVILRDEAYGRNIGTKKQYVAKSGDFVMSKIDARNGAYGIVPDELDGAVVTNDFPVFTLDQAKVSPDFFLLLTATREFLDFAQSCSSGTTGRQRIDMGRFLEMTVPLPPLKLQDSIAKDYNAGIGVAAQSISRAEECKSQINTYLRDMLGIQEDRTLKQRPGLQEIGFAKLERWSLNYLGGSRTAIRSSKFEAVPLQNIIVSLSGGSTPSKRKSTYWKDGTICWASPKDFKGRLLKSTVDRITKDAVREKGLRIYPAGTILAVFRSGILRHTFPVMITDVDVTVNQDLKAISVDETKVVPWYFVYYVQIFQQALLDSASKVSATVESINTDEFLQFKIPLPPIDIQRKIVEHISSMYIMIDNLQERALGNQKKAVQEFERAIFAQ